MLLIGMGGSGSHSLAQFATFLAGIHPWQINVTRYYEIREFQEDLRKLVVTAGRFTCVQSTQTPLLVDSTSYCRGFVV